MKKILHENQQVVDNFNKFKRNLVDVIINSNNNDTSHAPPAVRTQTPIETHHQHEITTQSIKAEPLHPTRITLQRPDYYTIPSMDDLFAHMTEDGNCFVPSFTIGREAYGSIFFDEPMDVAGLNLDVMMNANSNAVNVRKRIWSTANGKIQYSIF